MVSHRLPTVRIDAVCATVARELRKNGPFVNVDAVYGRPVPLIAVRNRPFGAIVNILDGRFVRLA